MTVLTIRTDKPEAEIGLFDNDRQVGYVKWFAHRQLSATIHQKILALLQSQGKTWRGIEAIVCFEGPGSFTGLRIGLAVGNALAYARHIPIIATGGEAWITDGIAQLQAGKNQRIALPHYGAEAHVTPPRK